MMMELKCAWDGLAKQISPEYHFNQSKFTDQSIILSGLYGDDVAFIKESNQQILIGKIIDRIPSLFEDLSLSL